MLPPVGRPLGTRCHIDVQGFVGGRLIGGFRKLDIPPVHLPEANPPWEEREIILDPYPPIVGEVNDVCIELQNPLNVAKTVTVTVREAVFGAGIGFTFVASRSVVLPPFSMTRHCFGYTPINNAALHRCLQVELAQPNFSPQFSQRNIDITTTRSLTFPLSTVEYIVSAMDGLSIGNPDIGPRRLELVIRPFGLPADRVVHIEQQDGTPLPSVLAPGAVIAARAVIRFIGAFDSLDALGRRQAAAKPLTANSRSDRFKIEVDLRLDGERRSGFTLELPDPPKSVFLPAVAK